MKYGYEIQIMECLYRAGFLMTVSRELSKYKLDLVGVQDSDERVPSAVRRVESVSDRMSYIILRGRCVISLF
jgi:hypothetical protein